MIGKLGVGPKQNNIGFLIISMVLSKYYDFLRSFLCLKFFQLSGTSSADETALLERTEGLNDVSRGVRQIHGFLPTLPKWKYSQFIAVNPLGFCIYS